MFIFNVVLFLVEFRKMFLKLNLICLILDYYFFDKFVFSYLIHIHILSKLLNITKNLNNFVKLT